MFISCTYMYIGSKQHLVTCIYMYELLFIIKNLFFRKSLRLSSAARKQTNVGEVVNLMSVDAQRLQVFPQMTNVLVDVPILTIITVPLVWQYLGPAAIVILVVLVLIIPFGALIAKLSSKLQV